jgi:hypothetical protein
MRARLAIRGVFHQVFLTGFKGKPTSSDRGNLGGFKADLGVAPTVGRIHAVCGLAAGWTGGKSLMMSVFVSLLIECGCHVAMARAGSARTNLAKGWREICQVY